MARTYTPEEIQHLVEALSYQDKCRILFNILWDVFGDVDDDEEGVFVPWRSFDKVDRQSLITSLRQEFWPEEFPAGDVEPFARDGSCDDRDDDDDTEIEEGVQAVRDYQLPDGTWVTTPVCAGTRDTMKSQCADGCQWMDSGPPNASGPVPVQMQRCPRCGWVRGKYLGDPHPAEEDEP